MTQARISWKKVNFSISTQSEISSVTFSLFSYFRDFFFVCDSNQHKALPFVHLLVLPKKSYLLWHDKHLLKKIICLICRFFTKIEISNARFWLFSYLSDLFPNSDSDQLEQLLFSHLSFVPRRKFTSSGTSAHFFKQKLTCHFLPKSRFQTMVLIFLSFSETCF